MSGRVTGSAVPEALAPVRDALLGAARAEADRILAQAERTARDVLAQAQMQASEIRAQAHARGAADAAGLIANERSQAGRRARAIVLAAERAEYEALREAARQAVAGLCDEPEYQLARRQMSVKLRRLLGDEAQLHEVPGGGMIATAPGRSADLSLTRLADRAVDTVMAEEFQLSAEVR
jgi:vacuolar-type H+-ATPase subunit E/Vma4